MKQITKARGAAAWSAAEKSGNKGKEAYFMYGGQLYSHAGRTYREAKPTGKPGDFGFCSDAADAAYNKGGVWID